MPTRTHLREAIDRLSVVADVVDSYKMDGVAPSIIFDRERLDALRLVLAAAEVFGEFSEGVVDTAWAKKVVAEHRKKHADV